MQERKLKEADAATSSSRSRGLVGWGPGAGASINRQDDPWGLGVGGDEDADDGIENLPWEPLASTTRDGAPAAADDGRSDGQSKVRNGAGARGPHFHDGWWGGNGCPGGQGG